MKLSIFCIFSVIFIIIIMEEVDLIKEKENMLNILGLINDKGN